MGQLSSVLKVSALDSVINLLDPRQSEIMPHIM